MRRDRLVGTLVLASGALALSLLPAAATPDEAGSLEDGHAKAAVPFLRARCLKCHDEKRHEADLVLAPLVEDGAHARHRSLWAKARERVHADEMPPEEEPRPPAAEREAFLEWTARLLSREAPIDPGRVTLRRMNRAEYGYTVSDLLHVAPRPHDEFPADDAGYGFDRIGDVLSLSPLLLERYLAAAESIAGEAILDWKPVKLRRSPDELQAIGTHGGTRDSFYVLYSEGRLEGSFRVALGGDYTLRVRAYGDQAGPDPARMGILVDGVETKRFDVPETQEKPKVYATKLTLKPGERRLAASFLNDYYKPDDPDPKQRDRNLAVEYLELEGPIERPALPWAHRTYFSKRPGEKATSEERRALAREVLAPFVGRAFRRPARPPEVERFAKLVELAVKEGESWERGLQLALQAILVSPSFLFRTELDAGPATTSGEVKAEPIDDYALATRLSYFLWSSLPDEELTKEAAAHTLRQDLGARTRRMLADPKASRLTEEFAVQWLQLRRLDTLVPDLGTFPEWDGELRKAARGETTRFFEAILRENRSVRELVDSPTTFLNERLAKHYGVEGIKGSDFVRADAPPGRRGLLGQASVLIATSNPTRTSPVKRGRWILDVLLDDPPPPPLPGQDSLKDEGTPVAAKRLRERMEQHRARKECAVCHARMDPLGFALERFDAIGMRREKDAGEEIDDAGTLPDGRKVDGADGLREWLSKRSTKIARALARKLLIFGTGRGPIAADDEALEPLLEKLAPEYKLQDLIVALVELDAFQKRRVEGGKKWH